MEQAKRDEESLRAKMCIPKKAFLSKMLSNNEIDSFAMGQSALDLLAQAVTPKRDDNGSQISIPDDLRISFSEIDDGSLPLDDLDFNCSPSPDIDLNSSSIMTLENSKELREDKDLQRITSVISSTSETQDNSLFPQQNYDNSDSNFSCNSSRRIQPADSHQRAETSHRLSFKYGNKNLKDSSSAKPMGSEEGLFTQGGKAGSKRSWDTVSQDAWTSLTKSEAPQVSTVGSSGEVPLKKKTVSTRRGAKNKHMQNKLCQVCGDIAAGFYCGAFICEACKKFYMRAYKQDKLKYVCLRDKNCVITKESRVQCQYCRFQKCVALNMYCPKQGEESSNKDTNMADIPCRVCSAPSSGFHFGAITCEGCKGFFRRMAKEREPEKYQCNKTGNCEINMITRNLCKACRYKQCLSAGMSVEGSRIGRQPNSVKHAISMELKSQVKPDMDEPATDLGQTSVQIKQEPNDNDNGYEEMKDDDLSFWEDIVTTEYQPTEEKNVLSKSSSQGRSTVQSSDQSVNSHVSISHVPDGYNLPQKFVQSQMDESGESWSQCFNKSQTLTVMRPPPPLPPQSPHPQQPQYQSTPQSPMPRQTQLPDPCPTPQTFYSQSSRPQAGPYKPQSSSSSCEQAKNLVQESSISTVPVQLVTMSDGSEGPGRTPQSCQEGNRDMDEFLAKIVEAGKVLQLLNYRVFDADMNPTTSMNVEDIKSLFKSKYMDPKMGNQITSNVDMSIFSTKESTWNYMMTNFHHNTYITIRFAKMVPGFKSLLLNDQVKLIQNSIYPIELLNMSKVFDPVTKRYNYFTYTKEEENIMMEQFPMLRVFQDHLLHIGEMVTSFNFTDEEFALLSALLLFPSEIHGLENPSAVDDLQTQISNALQYYEEKTFPEGLTRYGVLLVRVAELVQCLLQHNLAIGLLLTNNPSIQVPQLFHELIIESIKEGQTT